jgi:GNAT superfamily N-acetyltransferase
MPAVTVVRTWLEMHSPEQLRRAPSPEPSAVLDHVRCDVALYRALYASVGRAFHWHDRDHWSHAQLASYLARPDVAIWILRVANDPAGYFELVGHRDRSVEIAYFGLAQPYIGRGLGRFLLSRAADEAWALGARRVWLHTCTLDHPAALPNYLARGFRPWRSETYAADMPGT